MCGMDVKSVTAAGRTEYKGNMYYFCGPKCEEKFDHTPEQCRVNPRARARASIAVAVNSQELSDPPTHATFAVEL